MTGESRIASNNEVPALLALQAKGCKTWLEYHQINDPASPWHPFQQDYQALNASGTAYFSATTPVELLGLVAMWETRGNDWKWREGEPDVDDELSNAAKTFDADGNEIKDSH